MGVAGHGNPGRIRCDPVRVRVLPSPRRRVALAAALLALILAACGTDQPDGPALSAAAQAGEKAARDEGCAACHVAGGGTSVGPTWKGVWATIVELDDGSSVVFDEEYVERSVRDPGAQKRPGNWIQMPTFPAASVTDEQLASIADYISELGAA